MNTVGPRDRKDAFAIWITGLPASGKSTLTAAVKAQLAERGIDAAILESDTLRRILTPHPRYDEEERQQFYQQMVFIGALLVRHGVPVIFDATANLRCYREEARRQIARFLEVYLDCPLDTCMARDPKGIYRTATTVPGLQSPYEPPEHPDAVVPCGQAPEVGAGCVIAKLKETGFL